MLITILIIFLIAIGVLFCIRLIYVLKNRGKSFRCKRKDSVKTFIIIGSGGHTSEILRLTSELNTKHYSPRIYVMAKSDTSSEVKVHDSEKSNKDYGIVKIPRSRSVNQSYLTSIYTTIYSILYCIPLILRYRPSLVLCNGPGTCVPICVLAFILKLLYLSDTKIVFIESICRVTTLSLTGKILYWFADDIIVQWPQLLEKYKNTIYLGRLV